MSTEGTNSNAQEIRRNALVYSIIVPAYNEEKNVVPTISALADRLRAEEIPFELLIVDDNSTDATSMVVTEAQHDYPEIRLVHNGPPSGLGRAIRQGLRDYSGDVAAVVMADMSDDPRDVVACYRMIEEGYDAVFGSRFSKGSKVTSYPPLKWLVNRVVNRVMQLMFLTHHNDLTNAFKVYRRHVIDGIGPLHAAHFNITIEMSLSTLARQYSVGSIPISWSGRTWGSSNLKLKEMGRRYLCTLLKIWFERMLIQDDLLAEIDKPQ